MLLEKQERYDEAIEKFEKMVEINPESEKGYLELGATLFNLKRYDEAMSIYKKNLLGSEDIQIIHLYGELLMNVKKYKEAEDQFKRVIVMDPEYDQVHGSYGELLEKTNEKERAIIEYLRYLRLGLKMNSEELVFQEIYNEKIQPLLGKIKPEDYMKQFYTPGKNKKFSKTQLSTLLITLSKYDAVSEHIKDIIKTHLNEEGEKKQNFDLLIFTIKLSIWLKLCAGSLHEALRLVDFYVKYIRALGDNRQKEKEIFNFSVNLFRIQINSKINPEHILKVLEHLQKSKGVPFRDVILQIWTCLSDPDSVDAQRYMNEKAIGEVVKELKNKKDSETLVCDILTGA